MRSLSWRASHALLFHYVLSGTLEGVSCGSLLCNFLWGLDHWDLIVGFVGTRSCVFCEDLFVIREDLFVVCRDPFDVCGDLCVNCGDHSSLVVMP